MAGDKPLTAEREEHVRLQVECRFVLEDDEASALLSGHDFWRAESRRLKAEIDRLRSERDAAREAALREAAGVLDWWTKEFAGAVVDWGTGGTGLEDIVANMQGVILALINTPAAGAETGGHDG